MNNFIEAIDNGDDEFSDTYLLRNIETSGCSLVETLEKNVEILRTEVRQAKNIDSQLEAKLRYFNELSNALTCKLQSLVALAEIGIGEGREIKDFVQRITLSWVHANKQVMKEYGGIRVASRTAPGVPLTTLLNKIKKEAASVNVSLQIGSVIYDQDYVSRGYRIYDEISNILESLEHCDYKVQQFLVICKTTPYLVELSDTLDAFVARTDFLSSTISRADSSEDLTAFALVVKLLTGHLLAEETTNPRQILADNAPRKPVFITLNNKRKSDPTRAGKSKMSRSATFPPLNLQSK